MNLEDTIVAISSPPGASMRGIVRLSGPQAIQIASVHFRPDNGATLESFSENCCETGTLRVGPAHLPATAYVFRKPRSYTQQDMVELHLLGAPGVLGLVVEACLTAGARRAEAGEFTARAYLAGAMDLSQVHAVAGLIAARSDEQVRAAQRLLHGALARTAMQAREELADLLSLVEGALDFADEPIEFITASELRDRLERVHAALSATAADGLRAERWTHLPRVVLAGPPNAGKSSLLNRLTGLDRAICTATAGTTRDVLSAPLALEKMECLLFDIAGLDRPETGLDAKAQAAARRAMDEADLIVQIVDVTTENSETAEPPRGAACIRVGNKCDLLNAAQRETALRRLTKEGGEPVCLTSAATGEGCEQLKVLIEAALEGRQGDVRDAAIALMAEHREALERALAAVARAKELASACREQLESGDLVSAELRAAAAALGELVGQDQTEELLGRIFSRFCIGK